MPFFFGRRRSQSNRASLDHVDTSARRPSLSPRHILRRASDLNRAESMGQEASPGTSRKRSDNFLTFQPHPAPGDQGDENLSRSRASGLTRQQESIGSPRHGTRATSCAPSHGPDESAAAEHWEPKQPGNIQDLLEYRMELAARPKPDLREGQKLPSEGSPLSKKDIKALFSGAPHFLLERGKHGRWYPQVIFPWDEQNPSIQRLWDRKPLSHASFTLCTLHAHLPVPDDWAVKGGVPILLRDWRRIGAVSRPTFDVGIYEVPNMLSNNGREPGSIGFRHFLELPMADLVRYVGPAEPMPPLRLRRMSTLPATEAFELMEHYNNPYSQCQDGTVHDRKQLICDGPAAWKRFGVRDINLRSLTQRLDYLQRFRREMLRDGSTKTILDIEPCEELHNILYTHFLFPPPRAAEATASHARGLKSQIKILSMVLATPGAWIDFSRPEWRFRVGQVLWEVPPHKDGDFLDPNACGEGITREPGVTTGLERKWLLIQMLLATELLLRLDAFVRAGMKTHPYGSQLTIEELHQFDRLRNGKVNWDLIVVRRFLDSFDITYPPPQMISDGSRSKSPKNHPPDKPRRFSLLGAISHRRSPASPDDLRSAWECQLSSSHVRQQLEGVFVFGENIGWPRMQALKATMQSKLGSGENLVLPDLNFYDLSQTSMNPNDTGPMPQAKDEMYTRNASRRLVRLCRPCPNERDGSHAFTGLGWISRSWLSGFVIPGEGISHLLMATILENDPDAQEHLGSTANLYGGFVYGGRSWWSKACIVGRVLSSSEGAKTCMGWVSSGVLPRHAATYEPLEHTWFEVPVEGVSECSSKPRIKQGGRLAAESTPLGIGDLTAKAFTLPTDRLAAEVVSTVRVGVLAMPVDDYLPPSDCRIKVSGVPSITFSLHDAASLGTPTTVSFPLRYNVRFISSHECRPPLGSSSCPDSRSQPANEQQQQRPGPPGLSRHQRLPGHPLHRSFAYMHIPLSSLPDTPAPHNTPSRSEMQGSDTPPSPQVWVIDARGSRANETFARAWCASVGCHAIIGRCGRTCVACCVREARAVDVQVVVRVGE